MVFNEKPESELTPKELRERAAQTYLAASKVSIEAVYTWIAGTQEAQRLYDLAKERESSPSSDVQPARTTQLPTKNIS